MREAGGLSVMSQSDNIEHGPPPPDELGIGAFGTRAITHDGGRTAGVRIMLKGFSVMSDDAGEPIAYIEARLPTVVQAVQALRQAIGDARKRRFR